MRFKKIAVAMFACLALGAFSANVAQAEGVGWTIEGVQLAKNVHERIHCKKHENEKLIFHSTLLGAALTLEAEQVDCLEKAGVANEATIDNTTTPNHSEGVLTFTNVTVIEPKNCTVNGGEITTAPLTDTVIMDPTAGSKTVYDKFFPEAAGGAFVTIKMAGELCSIKGAEAPVKGTACGEAVHTVEGKFVENLTGENRVVQTLLFGEPQQTTGGCELKLGNAAAQLTGAVDNELASKKAFGSD